MTLLNELLDSIIKHKVLVHDANQYGEQVKIGDRSIVFSANLLHGYWEDGAPWEIEFTDGTSVQKTGHGNEMKVFSFVKAAFDRFIHAYNPSKFNLSASLEEPSRVRLYTSLVKRFSSGQYNIHDDINYGCHNWYFVLKKK